MTFSPSSSQAAAAVSRLLRSADAAEALRDAAAHGARSVSDAIDTAGFVSSAQAELLADLVSSGDLAFSDDPETAAEALGDALAMSVLRSVEVLLTFGGPSLRLILELDSDGEPDGGRVLFRSGPFSPEEGQELRQEDAETLGRLFRIDLLDLAPLR